MRSKFNTLLSAEIRFEETVNAKTTLALLKQIEQAYPLAPSSSHFGSRPVFGPTGGSGLKLFSMKSISASQLLKHR